MRFWASRDFAAIGPSLIFPSHTSNTFPLRNFLWFVPILKPRVNVAHRLTIKRGNQRRAWSPPNFEDHFPGGIAWRARRLYRINRNRLRRRRQLAPMMRPATWARLPWVPRKLRPPLVWQPLVRRTTKSTTGAAV